MTNIELLNALAERAEHDDMRALSPLECTWFDDLNQFRDSLSLGEREAFDHIQIDD